MRRYFASLPATLMPELAALALLALLYVSLWAPPPANQQMNSLDITPLTERLFNPVFRQTQLEHERLSGVLYPVKIGLERYGHIPTWNPYISSGEPIINNAFSYLFNPFHSLPVLLTDSYVQGTKLATFISLLLAGYNMWVLALVIGIGAVGRVLAGALYMTGGGIAGKFLAGHFQLALSLAWPPLVLAALWWTMRTQHRFAPVAFGISFALLFFAGNIYYVLHTLLACLLIVAIHLFDYFSGDQQTKSSLYHDQQSTDQTNGRFYFRRDRLRRALVAAVFAFGLAAVQFIPVWLTRDYVIHDNQRFNDDGTLENNYSLNQAFVNLTYPWEQWRQLPVSTTLAVSVDYAYIGMTPFLLILLALAALLTIREPANKRYQYTRIIWIATILAIIMMVWGSGQSSILQFLYQRLPLLAEFRFVGRALAVAAMWWILLAAISVDVLWKLAPNVLHPSRQFIRQNRVRLFRAIFLGLLAWAYFIIYSLTNTSTRLAMVLYNNNLLVSLDARRFTSFEQVMNALWIFLLISITLNSALLVIRTLTRRWHSSFVFEWRGAATRLIQLGVLIIVFNAIADNLTVNSRLYQFDELRADFSVFYPIIRTSDPDNPFPTISQPYAPSAFSGYEAEIRNWSIDEGWKPASIERLITWAAGGLSDLPRWAIVSGAYGGSSLNLAKQFVADNGYQQRQCAFINPYALTDDPCDLESLSTAILYEKPDALPYAFVAPAETLKNSPAQLNGTNVFPARVINHHLDSITVEAQTPDTDSYFLVVQEIHYPGWHVSTNGIPIQSATAEIYHDVNGSRGFIAVPMQPGTHTYSLRFEPPGFNTGMLISLVTLVIVGFYVVRRRGGAG